MRKRVSQNSGELWTLLPQDEREQIKAKLPELIVAEPKCVTIFVVFLSETTRVAMDFFLLGVAKKNAPQSDRSHPLLAIYMDAKYSTHLATWSDIPLLVSLQALLVSKYPPAHGHNFSHSSTKRLSPPKSLTVKWAYSSCLLFLRTSSKDSKNIFRACSSFSKIYW